MPGCRKCWDLQKAIKKTPVVSGSSQYPSTLELAYMVNLEYYIDISYKCIHKIPEVDDAKIKIKEMIGFLESKQWQLSTRTNNHGFKSSSFLNHPSKQLVIVHRGTENWQQMKADILLAMDIINRDVIEKADWHTTQSLLNNALKEDNNKFVRNDYSVTITGHSLGGWLAQICTLLSKNPQYHPYGPRGFISFGNGKSVDMNQPYDLHCVAFDSPGASTVLNKLEVASAWLLGNKRDVEDALQHLDITIYLSNPNIVNSCGKHVGKLERIDVLKNEWFWQRWKPLSSHSMERILAYFIRTSKA